MKNLATLFVMLFSVSVFAGNEVGKLEVGDQAVHTNVKMLDVSGEKVSLSDVKGENGLLVVFSCNTCPFVLKWEDRYVEAKSWADKNGVGMIVLNSNHTKRSGDDSYEEMKKHASAKNYNFRYVVDENSLLANAFGGQVTPHVFLFDKNMKLSYKGAIDNNANSGTEASETYLKDALSSLGQGTKIAITETKPTGCGIKRKLD